MQNLEESMGNEQQGTKQADYSVEDERTGQKRVEWSLNNIKGNEEENVPRTRNETRPLKELDLNGKKRSPRPKNSRRTEKDTGDGVAQKESDSEKPIPGLIYTRGQDKYSSKSRTRGDGIHVPVSKL